MHRTLIPLSAVLFLVTGCAAARHAEMPSMAPLVLEAAPAAPILQDNHFARDRMSVGEAELKQILAAPVFFEEAARVGVLPVAAGYGPEAGVPFEAAPATLVDAFEASGLVDLSTEVSTEWPVASGLPGLRELAARYRTEYLLLYRHRFNDVTHANAWAWGFLTLVGALFLPGTSYESAGVLEATLFDVKTGTILFTVHERVRGGDKAAPPDVKENLEALHRKLIGEASRKLADQVIARCHRLVATRPAKSEATAYVPVSPAP
ncbi:MAG: hypothetical protein AB1938_23375 [Myxococcota bacterium]